MAGWLGRKSPFFLSFCLSLSLVMWTDGLRPMLFQGMHIFVSLDCETDIFFFFKRELLHN